ncbi:F-box protein GID2 protein [Dioscorea alata]|uniref:F-box protein GID2 protein n=1 Tax=Dioscorea alata TaxID=55571 RepID=A0ACB7UI14_DIOAL|nr:F-box protein GID2 protein [Dioscorea alata]
MRSETMKRISSMDEMPEASSKKAKLEDDQDPAMEPEPELVTPRVPELGDDLVFEVLKRADARTLAAAACVSRRWRAMTKDERIWEAVCARQWANFGCGNQQLRSVVLALGGFRQLHSLTQQQPAVASSSSSSSSVARRAWIGPARFGKDEVHLLLSLLSIGYFEKMNGFKRGSGA